MPTLDASRMTITPVTPSDVSTLGGVDALFLRFTGNPGTVVVGIAGEPNLTITSAPRDIVLSIPRVNKLLATGTSGVDVFVVRPF